MKELSLIIVSFNTKGLLEAILTDLLTQTGISFETIVVDNASADGSPQMVAQKFPHVTLIRNQSNAGFGVANNLGAKVAQGEYLLFLNSDTRLPSTTTLKDFLKRTQKTKAIIASCRLINPNGSLQPQGGALPNLLNIPIWMLMFDDLPFFKELFPSYQRRSPGYFKRTHRVGWVGGTAMLIKKSAFDSLNGFDPKIFMYSEDVDLCKRAQDEGYSTWYVHQPSITHLGQGSATPTNALKKEFEGLLYYIAKHHPRQKLYYRLWLKLGALLRTLVFGMIGKHEKRRLYQSLYHLV
jgi:GT2 family glycosyltransferase